MDVLSTLLWLFSPQLGTVDLVLNCAVDWALKKIYLSICLFIFLFVSLSIYLYSYLSVCRSVYLSVCLSIDLSIRSSVCLSVCLPMYVYVYMYLPICLPVIICLWWLLSQFQTWNPRCWRRRRQRLTTGTTPQHNRSTATASTADNTTDNTTDNTAETVRMICVSYFIIVPPCMFLACLVSVDLVFAGVVWVFCIVWLSGLGSVGLVWVFCLVWLSGSGLCFGLVWLRGPGFPSGLWFWNPRLVAVVGNLVFSSQFCLILMSWCLMSSDFMRHIRDKLWPMPKHGSINLYVHGNQKAR